MSTATLCQTIVPSNILQSSDRIIGRLSGSDIDGVSNSSIITNHQGIEVDVINLDEYQDLKPTFIKIDVEGFEQEVLQGAMKVLDSKPKLAIELHTEVLNLLSLAYNSKYRRAKSSSFFYPIQNFSWIFST